MDVNRCSGAKIVKIYSSTPKVFLAKDVFLRDRETDHALAKENFGGLPQKVAILAPDHLFYTPSTPSWEHPQKGSRPPW